MENYYCTPVCVGHTLYKFADIEGKVFVPYEVDSVLSNELRHHGLQVTSNKCLENLFDLSWWLSHGEKEYDWVINCNYGLKEPLDYILKYSPDICKKGMAFLDRISFLEPTVKRRDFLLKNKITQQIIFSPRPSYRSLNNLKDSVTSAWFLMHKPSAQVVGSSVDFAVNWAELPDLQDVSKNRSVI